MTNVDFNAIPRFTDNGDGTVTDTRNNLIWLKNANCYGYQRWSFAKSVLVAGLNDGECGLSDDSAEGDWRLPTKEELQGIGTDPPATWLVGNPSVKWTIPGQSFINVISHSYWSKTEYADLDPWVVDLQRRYTATNGSDAPINHCSWPVCGGN